MSSEEIGYVIVTPMRIQEANSVGDFLLGVQRLSKATALWLLSPFTQQYLLKRDVDVYQQKIPVCDIQNLVVWENVEYDKYLKLITSENQIVFMIEALFSLGRSEIIGRGVLRDIDHELGRAEVSILLGIRDSQGNLIRGYGYGLEAVNQMCAFAFNVFSIKELVLGTYSDNPAYGMFKQVGFCDTHRTHVPMKDVKRYIEKENSHRVVTDVYGQFMRLTRERWLRIAREKEQK